MHISWKKENKVCEFQVNFGQYFWIGVPVPDLSACTHFIKFAPLISKKHKRNLIES